MNLVQDPTQLVMLDGQMKSATEPVLRADLPGLMRGEGIFETFLVRDGKASPWLAQHDARLVHSAQLTDFTIQPGDLIRSFAQFAPAVSTGHWRVRFTLFRGLEQQHALWTAGPEPKVAEAVDLMVSSFRLDPLNPIAGAKTVSRIDLQVARRQAHQLGAYDALLQTIHGDLAEGTSTNVFLWMDEALHTPSMDCGILGGVTRYAVLEACKRAKIPVFERRIPLQELPSAVEVYITNAVIGLLPVSRILDWCPQLPGPQGDALQRLQQAYRSFLAKATDSPS